VLTDPETRSEFLFFDGPVLTMQFARDTIEDYIPNVSDRTSELASPIKISAAHAKLQPPTLIINGSVDILRSGGSSFGEILQQQGVECVVLTGHGQLHDSEVWEATRSRLRVTGMKTRGQRRGKGRGLEVRIDSGERNEFGLKSLKLPG
jgi:acetyl esterase